MPRAIDGAVDRAVGRDVGEHLRRGWLDHLRSRAWSVGVLELGKGRQLLRSPWRQLTVGWAPGHVGPVPSVVLLAGLSGPGSVAGGRVACGTAVVPVDSRPRRRRPPDGRANRFRQLDRPHLLQQLAAISPAVDISAGADT